MINNINNLNTNSLLEVKNLLEFCKTFVFKNKFTADNNETKISLYNSSFYIRACMNPSANIPSNLPYYTLSNLEGNTNQDIINIYIKNTYNSILSNTIPGNLTVNNTQDFIDYFLQDRIADNVQSNNNFAELNIYYRKLFISYYNILINKYGDIEQGYENNINLLDATYKEELEKLLLYIFECRIYNHLDILYYNTDFNLSGKILSLFFELYINNKTYFLKTIYTEGFEIQENYFNFCKFFVVFMTIQQFVNKKMEIVFDIDLLDDYSIINFLYSYGIYFLEDLPIYYQKRVIKNIQRLLNNKGNNQVIANILDIFELPDDTVFKYYMEKKYTGNVATDVKFIGIPYSEYSYINYIDSKQKTKVRSFEYFTSEDDSWKTEKEFILEPDNEINFDYIQSKYLSIESTFELQTFAAECSLFFDTIYRSKRYINNDFANDKKKTIYAVNGFDIFDGLIALATLAMYINGAEETIIFKSNYLNNRQAFNKTGVTGLSDYFLNTGLEISKYFIVDEIKTKNTKTIVSDITANLNFRKDLEEIICDSTDYYEYRGLLDDYKILYQSETNRSYFTNYNTYMDYLEDNCYELYELIYSAKLKEDSEYELLKIFGILAEDLKSFINSRRLVWDMPSKLVLLKFLYYMIDYFKSYTVQLDNFKIIYKFANELENRLFLFDYVEGSNIRQNYLIADLIGGEMYEGQQRPLSLHDNFYNHEKYLDIDCYRKILSTIVAKDKLNLRDYVKVTIATSPALPTYILTQDITSVSEGSSVTFTVTTTGVPDGAILAWEVIPGITTLTDINPNSGTVTVQNNTATFQITALIDQLIESPETFTVRLTAHPEVVSEPVTITADPVPTYSLSTTPVTLAEGETTTATVTTTNVVNGTVLHWEVVPGTTTFADTTPNLGTVTIQNNTATWRVTAQTDAAAEQAETFRIRLTDHHEATSETVTITAPILTPLAAVNQGGWYGGELNTNEIWLTSVSQSYDSGNICTEYRVNKTTWISVRITEIPNGDYRREVKKVGDYWFSIVGAGYEIRDLAYNKLNTETYWNGLYRVEYDQSENKSYYHVNIGGAWTYGVKTELIPTVGKHDWVYDADYPTSQQGGNLNELALSADYVWHSSVALQKVEAVSRNWEAGTYGVTTAIFPVPTNNFNLARKSIPVANSVNSRMTCSPNYLFITQPLLGTVAKIDMVTGSLTNIAVEGLKYTNENYVSKPSYCVWLPGLKRVAVSCLGNNTLKLYTEAGVLTNTLQTGTAPGKAFEVDSVLYVPCMEQNITNRISF